MLADRSKLSQSLCLLLMLDYQFFSPQENSRQISSSYISFQAQVDAIAEHSPPSAPAATNGSNNDAADSEGSNARSSTERPAKVSYKGDSNPEAVSNGLS